MIPTHLSGAKCKDVETFMPDVWEYLIRKYAIRSVIDIGCGYGANGAWFLEHGLRVCGVDGCPEAIAKNLLPSYTLAEHDYRYGPYLPNECYDLGWCSEFVEHVEAEFISNFLATFTVCKHICLTHATPGQGGCHHVNEQPTQYWIEKLAAAGFAWDEQETQYLRATKPESIYGRRTLTWFNAINHLTP